MNDFLPGTKIELHVTTPNVARDFLDNIFLSGGLVMSQLSRLTGLEPYEVQNWVKRGFLPPPQHKQYNKNQFCRLATINMLRETMQIEKVTKLLSYINGHLDDESDDLVDDSDLYNYYVNLIAMLGGHMPDEDEIHTHIRYITNDFAEPHPGARERLAIVLEVMVCAHYATVMRRRAEDLLHSLE